MKKQILLFIVTLCLGIQAYPQATSITVDNQTPGWLSSKINYGDQQTIRNIKVSGYINGTDVKFIRELNLYRSLSGVIDLEDANIVAGGEAYGTFATGMTTSISPMTKDNMVTIYMFSELLPIRKVILPKSLEGFSGGYEFLNTRVDTLIINGCMKSISIGHAQNAKDWHIKCVYFPSNVESIDFGRMTSDIEYYLPDSLKSVGSNDHCYFPNGVFHSSSFNPEDISVFSFIPTSAHPIFFEGGTIYVPAGMKSKYENSIFSKLTIIEDIRVEGLSLNESKSLYVGDETQLLAQVQPEGALNQNVIWESSNTDVATVSEEGLITALLPGKVNITATTVDGGYKATCEVSVYEHTTGVQMVDNVSIPINGQYELDAQTFPLSTSDGRIEYSCSNNNIATISNTGTITGVAKGSCTITATSVDGGYTAECVVTVTQPVEALSLEKHNLSLKVGDIESMYAQIAPLTADDKTLNWYSRDEEVATVDESGNVSALKAGETWIVAVSNDNAEAKDSCKVTVQQPVNGITLNHSTYTMNRIGDSFELEATVQPDDASNKNIKWMSSNESVCMVSNGMVVAVGAGTCVIIATTEDGAYMATCTVSVTVATGVSFVEINDDQSFQIYDVNGMIRTSFKKGINIIRFVDGTIKKIYIE